MWTWVYAAYANWVASVLGAITGASRLTPIAGAESIHGRTGLLAHTYMLGPGGDSNGCVSFKNYDAFLQAFRAQKVKRLAVVASL